MRTDVLALGAAVIIVSTLVARFAAERSAPESCRPASRADAAWMRAHRSFLAGRGPGTRVVFIGDSLVAGWLTDGRDAWGRTLAPLGARAFGIPGDRTQNVLWRIGQGELGGMPNLRAVVLCVGVNNALLGHPPEDIARGVMACVAAARRAVPSAYILVVAPPPAGDGPTAGRVRRANDLIARACGALDIPIGSTEQALAPDGVIERSLAPDGLHPNAEGYRRWADVLVPTLRAWSDGPPASEKPAS
ncbi:MAG TPA: GDSL-type esterase/lipase family protein [Phycisphaerales bacterium]|nr:GDSL-type esterase/lipase family protein [Phycisphaerales bacterium]